MKRIKQYLILAKKRAGEKIGIYFYFLIKNLEMENSYKYSSKSMRFDELNCCESEPHFLTKTPSLK